MKATVNKIISNEMELYDFLESVPLECKEVLSMSGSVDRAAEYWVTTLKMRVNRDFAINYLEQYGFDFDKEDQISEHSLCQYILWINSDVEERR